MSQSRWQEKGPVTPSISPSKEFSFLSRPVALLLFSFLFVGLGVLAWWGYAVFTHTQDPSEIPVIQAEEGPYKVRPEDPHTHKIPHKEKTIYEHFSREKGRQQEKDIKLRSLPEAPVKEGPTLPADFIQAFSDAGQEATSLLTDSDGAREGGKVPAGISPFMAEGAEQKEMSPFAEQDGFFERHETRENKRGASGDELALEKSSQERLTDNSLDFSQAALSSYPQKVSCLEGICVAGAEKKPPQERAFCLELCQAPSEEKARERWHLLIKKAPDLLAAQKVIYKKIDHGKGKLQGQDFQAPQGGFLYHVILPKLSKKRADVLQKELFKRGLYASQLPF